MLPSPINKNREGVASMPEPSLGKEATHIVISLTATLPEHTDCRTIPADNMFFATHTQVYGPESKEACDAWVFQNCGILKDI